MEEVAPQLGCVCVCMSVCLWSSYLHSKTVANHWIVKRQGILTQTRSLGVKVLFFSFSFFFSNSPLLLRYRLKRCGRSRSEHYAFRLQAAMGRAVMVGRGPTGAGVLVLSILIVLTTESCRAQKGWWHTAAVTTAGAEWNRSDMRPCCFLKCEHKAFEGLEMSSRHVVIVRRSYYTHLTWPCVRGVPLGLHRLPPPVLVFFGETHHDGRVWWSETRQTGSEGTEIVK